MTATSRAKFALAMTASFALCASLAAQPGPASAATSTQGAAATVTVKPIIQGFLDRQQPPPKSMQSVVHAYVVKVNWADLQPTQGGPITANNAIDQAIARVNQADFAGLGMALKLRVFAGVGAPDWAKSLGGAPLPYYGDPTNGGGSGTIGRFWTADFGAAYADLENKLAAKYDSVPSIREITVSRCTTMYDEPFVRDLGDSRNITTLLAAGYTIAADKQCIVDSIAAHDVWKQTTSDVDFSPFPLITPLGQRDLAFTESVMDQCRTMLGRRCGLQNNSLSTDKLSSSVFNAMYAHMTALGPPIVLQTARLATIGTITQVLGAATSIGANSVELPNGYAKWSLSVLQPALAALLQNPIS
ncbi:MAG TPA: hypothetical protein VGN35_09240 [Jatrophihabitantaceae bacterium]|jgi:hypothetical protein|nr:hypothetical protein [Jatrophihabitantaceae bacterium]